MYATCNGRRRCPTTTAGATPADRQARHPVRIGRTSTSSRVSRRGSGKAAGSRRTPFQCAVRSRRMRRRHPRHRFRMGRNPFRPLGGTYPRQVRTIRFSSHVTAGDDRLAATEINPRWRRREARYEHSQSGAPLRRSRGRSISGSPIPPSAARPDGAPQALRRASHEERDGRLPTSILAPGASRTTPRSQREPRR